MPDTHTRTQHTPGPWTAENAYIYATQDRRESYHLIADVYAGHWLPEVRNANAHLIAAAPDLLSALERMVEEAETNYIFGEDASEEHALNQANAAIRKARGEE